MFRDYNVPLICSLYVVVLLFAGCSSGSGNGGTNPPAFDIEIALADAWGQFAAGSYATALSGFDDILTHDSTNAEAYIGKGWCYAYQGKFSTGIWAFNEAKSHGTASLDADMGSAVIYRDLPDYAKAATFAAAVIYVDSSYTFRHRATVDFKDAHLIMAESYFHQGESRFSEAAIEIDYLCGILRLEKLPSVGSVTDDEYEKAMASKLEDLSELLSD